ncbi:hypothetical protein TNIN_203111 [Trichonephila inaurata madagascariensis]|uniref:Uncharacterized protein n=1 Tax=Trichonephila inaurata madagascariensis TaxID=2747483 RepID=A0A8X6XHZ8_9ARAC|nr:hypothetical protein TNIN_203111 [Trichonephila inaurata madagascariensis]
MYYQFFIIRVWLVLIAIQLCKTRTFVPERLGENVQQLCVSLQSRIRCPKTACSGNLRNCTGHAQCNCFPTRIEVCCSTTGGNGCCLNVPMPLTIGK